MNVFKSLVPRHLLHHRPTPSRQPAASRWLRVIRKALLPRAATAAAEPVDAAALSSSSGDGERHNNAAPAAALYAGRHADRAEDRTLPANHPDAIRVHRIAASLIAEARDDRNYGRLRLLPERIIRRPIDDGINWNIGVLAAAYGDAYSHRKGKIRVSAGLLKILRNDAEVATVLGHEVGHVIARHNEKMHRNMVWVGFLVNFLEELMDVPGDKIPRNDWKFLFMRPCYFRQEFEADRIGLLLLAAAGYDPRVSPRLLADVAYTERELELDSDLSTHPPTFKRAQVLLRTRVMDQALDLYGQALTSGKNAEVAQGSWASSFSFKYGLSWGRFWADQWLQGVSATLLPQNLWNSVSSLPPFLRSRVSNSVRNNCLVAQVPASKRLIPNSVGSLLVQQVIDQCDTDYTSDWQQLNDANDVVSWRWTEPGAYLASSAYKMFFQGNVDFPCAKLLWKSCAPLKVKVFMSLLLNGKLLTVDRYECHGLQCYKQCPFCARDEDPAAPVHMAFNCRFAKEVWWNILSRAGIPVIFPPAVPSVDVWWKYLRSSVAKERRKALDTLLILVTWHLWLERNARISKDETMQMTSTQLTNKVEKEAFAWIGAGASTWVFY